MGSIFLIYVYKYTLKHLICICVWIWKSLKSPKPLRVHRFQCARSEMISSGDCGPFDVPLMFRNVRNLLHMSPFQDRNHTDHVVFACTRGHITYVSNTSSHPRLFLPLLLKHTGTAFRTNMVTVTVPANNMVQQLHFAPLLSHRRNKMLVLTLESEDEVAPSWFCSYLLWTVRRSQTDYK